MARNILVACFAILAILAISAMPTANAQETTAAESSGGLTLRDTVVVDDALVRLGDLFFEPLDNPEIPVAEAPAPGKTVVLDSRRLRHIAVAYGLSWRPVSKLQRVEISRLSQHVTPEQIVDAVRQAIAQAANTGADLQIRLDGQTTGFDLPTDVVASLDLRDVNYDPVARRFSAVLVAPANGPALVNRPVSGSVAELAQIPVPRRLISAGEIISTEDLDWIWIEVDRLANFHLTDAAQVIGQVAQRPLRAGQPMRVTDVAQSPLIKKNGLVRLIVTSGPMTLSARGRALEDGAYGQAVQVMNVDSNRKVSGVVQDAGTVTIATDVLPSVN